MLHIPPRGRLPECWINPAQIISIYYIGHIVYIELPRTTVVLVYKTEADAITSTWVIRDILNIPETTLKVLQPIDGGIRQNQS